MHYILRQKLPENSTDKPIEIHLTGDEVTVGRSSILQLEGFPQISRQHAVFYRTNAGRLFVKDCGSLNGVFVNNAKIGKSLHPVDVGDIIGLGVPFLEGGTGFVCVVGSSDLPDKIKHEIIDLTIDDDDVPSINTANSTNSNIGPQNTLKNHETLHKSIPEVEPQKGNIQNLNHSHGEDEIIIIKTESSDVPPCESSSHSGSHNAFSTSNAVNKSNCEPSFNPAVITPVQSTSIPVQNNNVQEERLFNCMPIKRLYVSLVKCDSEHFEWPPDVQNPLKKKKSSHHERPAPLSFKSKKHIRKLSSDSDNETVSSLVSINQNIVSDSENKQHGVKDQLEVVNNIQTSVHKRNVNEEATNIFPPSSKKMCITKRENFSFSDHPSKDQMKIVEPQIEMSLKTTLQKNEIHKSEKHSDCGDNIHYSQVDEIIYISDDESYLDFNSSQNYVPIKKEVCSDVSEDEEIKEIFDCKSESLPPATSESSLHQSKSPCDRIESVESIRAFVDSLKPEHSKDITSDFSKGGNDVPHNDYFPVLSQEFENSEESTFAYDSKVVTPSSAQLVDNNNGKNSSKENHASNASDVKSKGSINKSIGRTLLTDPKPMAYRPRKLRGREEGFTEHIKYQTEKSPDNKKQKKRSKKNLEQERISSSSKSTADQIQIGSINSKLKNFKIPHKSKAKDQMHNSSDEKKPENSSKDVSLPKATVKKSSVKTRPDKFASRMGFLTSEIDINPRKAKQTVTGIKAQSRPEISDRHTMGKQNTVPQINNNISSKTPAQLVSVNNVSSYKSDNIHRDLNAAINNSISSKTITQPANVNTVSSYKSGGLHLELNAAISNSVSSKNIVQPASVNNVSNYKYVNNRQELNAANNSVSSKTIAQPASVNNVSSYKSNNIHQGMNVAKPTDPRKNRAVNSLQKNMDKGRQPQVLNNVSSVPTTQTVSTKAPSATVVNKNRTSAVLTNRVPVRSKRENNVSHEVSSLGLIKDLIKMNPVWLKEQVLHRVPPSEVRKGAADLPLYFKSYQSYVSSFYPMIMLELWEGMFTESKEIFKSKKVVNKFYFSVLSYHSREDCIELQCESVINEMSYEPREGVIALLELKEDSKVTPMFGYIFKHKVNKLYIDCLKNPLWKQKLSEDWLRNAQYWIFNVYIRKRDMTFQLKSLMKGNGMCYIRSKLRLVTALSDLEYSPLVNDILNPTWSAFSVDYGISSPTREYTSSQMQVIKGISAEIDKRASEPKIILVQGPPGTGKTHTLIGLLEKLVYESKSNQKILVVTPSNAAIDEIGCRLIDLNEQLSWKDNAIKFVRVGLEKQIHKKILPFFLDKKALELYRQTSQCESKRKENELQDLLTEISSLERRANTFQDSATLKYKREQYRRLKEQSSGKGLDYYTSLRYKENILKDSHIVLSTLNSCGLSILCKTFKPDSNVHFSCCIVDEATQCTELEVLQPLSFGINKLVLIGDHEQLPATVISKLASQHGFERSMFERFHLFFEVYKKRSPIFMLTEQFRMHSMINHFPSKHFYSQKLITDPGVDVRYMQFPFHPYILLDMLDSQELDDASSKLNCQEADVIISICRYLIDIIDSPSIGIITPYQGQKNLYEVVLRKNPRFQSIEVNTIDGFQGREKDVIIMSCVRANSLTGGIGFLSCRKRLNVAITRAKKCLIICAHTVSLMTYPDWKSLICDARDRKVCFSVSTAKDVPYVINTHLLRREEK